MDILYDADLDAGESEGEDGEEDEDDREEEEEEAEEEEEEEMLRSSNPLVVEDFTLLFVSILDKSRLNRVVP